MSQTKNYTPAPIDTTRVTLPAELVELTEKLAENAHEVWSRQRIGDGWVLGENRNDALKTHPSLRPYDELSEDEKEYDRQVSMETIKAIVSLGYDIKLHPDAAGSVSKNGTG